VKGDGTEVERGWNGGGAGMERRWNTGGMEVEQLRGAGLTWLFGLYPPTVCKLSCRSHLYLRLCSEFKRSLARGGPRSLGHRDIAGVGICEGPARGLERTESVKIEGPLSHSTGFSSYQVPSRSQQFTLGVIQNAQCR
jgi:hypothetical protein